MIAVGERCKRQDGQYVHHLLGLGWDMNEKILKIKNLEICFHVKDQVVRVVDGVSFCMRRGETLGLVGESGCGKSVSALSILQLLDCPPARIHAGEIWFDGKNLLALTEKQMRKLRGSAISMIFQEPMTSLNPLLSIGFQMTEMLRLHMGMRAEQARERAQELLRLVEIPLPEKRLSEHPHQLSGGMRQRVMVAMALACNPDVLIADEPTTALDVTIQAQIMDLMINLQKDLGTAILFITHDLGVIAEMAQRVVVMYAGKVVETADVINLFQNPQHPYTKGLLAALPRIDRLGEQTRLVEIPGMVPELTMAAKGCTFFNRCPNAQPWCSQNIPNLETVAEGHKVRCWIVSS